MGSYSYGKGCVKDSVFGLECSTRLLRSRNDKSRRVLRQAGNSTRFLLTDNSSPNL